jgi:hypothetical protein
MESVRRPPIPLTGSVSPPQMLSVRPPTNSTDTIGQSYTNAICKPSVMSLMLSVSRTPILSVRPPVPLTLSISPWLIILYPWAGCRNTLHTHNAVRRRHH